MKLTEREKWLMQQAWNHSKYCDHVLKKMDTWLNKKTEFYDASIEMLLVHDAPEPESIVKTVDPKNLPDFEVLILDQKSELYSTGLFIENQRVVGFLNSKHGITRYIEIKDIIKLLED